MEGEESISFVDQKFLNSRPLNDTNVLEYFSGSPFYDRSCNNEILKMQTQFSGLGQRSKLSSMIGVFYEVMSNNPEKTLFTIRKAYNHGVNTETMRMYYIIHGHVYSAPTNHSIYRCRMSDLMWLLNSFINRMVERRSFNPFKPFKEKCSSTELEKNSDLEFAMQIFNDFQRELGCGK